MWIEVIEVLILLGHTEHKRRMGKAVNNLLNEFVYGGQGMEKRNCNKILLTYSNKR